MAKNDWGDALVTAESPLDWGDRPAAQQDLPDGVKPSTAGGGRGVTPTQAYVRSVPAAPADAGADTMSAEFGGPEVVDAGPRVSVLQDQPMPAPDPGRRLSLGAGPITQQTAARAERMVDGQDPGTENRAVVERAARGIEQQVAAGERNTFGDLVDTATLEDRRAATGREMDTQRRRDFAQENPVMGGVASGAAGLVAGMINTPQLAADALNKTVVDPVLQAAGQGPMPSPGTMPGTKALTELAAEYAPVVGQQPMEQAWDKGEFGPWLVANLAQQSPQIAQSIAAAFAPPLRAVLLPAMGAQSAGMSYVAGDDPRVALAKGAVEIGTEMLPLKVFDRVGEMLARVPANAQRTVLAQAGQRLMAAGGAITANALTNAVEESIAQVSGNALDQVVAGKDGSLSEGVGEAAVIGGLTGAGIGAPQAVAAGARDNSPQGQAARELSRALNAPVPQQTVAPTGLNPNLRQPTDRTEQIKALRAAGDKTAADLLQRRQDREMSAYTAERETEALQPFGAGVQQRYREMRLAGVMPGDAVTQTAMRVNFEQAAQAAGLSEKARDAALKKAETMPPDQAPGFLQKALQAFTSKGLAKPIEGAERLAENIESQRDQLLDAVLTADIRPTMAAIEELEQGAPVAPQATTAASQDGDWRAFAPETGTLSVPRAEMPQIKSVHRGAMVNFLNARGVTHDQGEVDPATLKPTQAEFSASKVEQATSFTGPERSILVSSDGHVVDGHHQWLAKMKQGEPVKVIRLNAPIAELLPVVREFPSSTFAGQDAQQTQAVANAEMTGAELGSDRTQGSARTEQRNSFGDIPADIAVTTGLEASNTEGSMNGADGDSKTGRDVSGLHPALGEGFGKLDIPAQRDVLNRVLAFGQDSKVVGSIVQTIPVDVMNNLVGPELAAKARLGDVSMLVDALAVDNDLLVRGGHVRASSGGAAGPVAKDDRVNPARASDDAGTAVRTDKGDGGQAETSEVENEGAIAARSIAGVQPDGLASADEQRRASAEADRKRNEKRARLTSSAWSQNPLRAFLGKHGISSALANEFAPGAAERRKAMVPGYGPIFRKAGKNIDMLAEAAREEGFIQGEDTAELYDLIARVFRGEKVIPMFAEGAAEMEMESRQAAMEEDAKARFEDYAAADIDPFTPDDEELLEAVGYDQADAATQAEFRALIAAAEAEGIDTETILEDAHYATQEASDDQYRQRATADIQAARSQRQETAGRSRAEPRREATEPAGREDGQPVPGPQSSERPEVAVTLRADGTLAVKGDATTIRKLLADAGITNVLPMRGGVLVGKSSVKKAQALLDPPLLSAPTRADVEAQQERTAKATRDAAKKDADAKAEDARDRERREVARRSEAAADTFELGQDPMANLTGQADIFAAAPAPAPQTATKKSADGDRLTDAGEELTRNRRGKLKGLAWADVSDMNDTLKVAQVIKANVWPRPDYAKMVEDGAPAWKAAALKAVYDKLAAAPSTRAAPTDADLRGYIETMQSIRDALMAELDRAAATPGGEKTWQSLKAENVFGKVFKVPADARPMFGKPSPFDRSSELGKENNKRALVIGGNSAVGALQFDSRVLSKIKSLVLEGFPARQEAWQKSWEVRATETRNDDIPEAERTGEPQQRFYVYEKGSRWRLAKGGQDGGYATEEQAAAFARSLTVRKKEVLPPSRGLDLADAKRTGPDWRNGKDVTAQEIIDRFGFRGVNLGEYVKAKQGIAQVHLNHVYDAFSDLADVLGVPPKAMSLNGELGVAIGAQGSGKALAHFVPGVNEINITRDSGAGALAHEFGHAMDHYFAAQHGRAASVSKRPYLSAVVRNTRDDGGVRPEVMEAMRLVMKTLSSRPMTEAEARKYMEDQRTRNVRYLESWVKEFSGNRGADPAALKAIAAKLKLGDVGEGTSDGLEANIVEFIRAAGLKPGNSTTTSAVMVAYRLRDLADEANFLKNHIPQVDTNYAKASNAMDAKKSGDGYWGTPWEMFARAFETYVMDALQARQRESLYLSGLVDSDGWRDWAQSTGKSIPYPEGEERLQMQQAFQKMVETIQTKTDDDGNVAMFARSTQNGEMTTSKEFYSRYAQHIDIRGRTSGDAYATRAQVLADGFKKGSNVNAVPPSRGAPYTSIMDRRFAPQAGDVVYFAPPNAWTKKPNGMEIRDGWVPKPWEAVVVQPDEVGKPMYEVFRRAWTESARAPNDTAFDRWFGDSKVVDADGKPQVMYHGTRGDISVFEPDSNGLIFVTPNTQVADNFAVSGRGRDGSPNVLPVYVSAKKPFDHQVKANRTKLIDKLMELHPTFVQGDGQQALLINGRPTLYTEGVLEAALADDSTSTWALLETPSIVDIVERAGFDSMYVMEDGVKNLALFDSAQIKSATGNRGTFDPNDPDIRASRTLDADLFRRMTAPMKRGMEVSSVDRAIAPVLKRWKSGPTVQVVDSTSDLPVDAPGDVQGMYLKGNVYLVASSIRTPDQVMRVLGHEAIAHHGLREMLGRDGFRQFTNQVQLALKTGNKALAAIQAEVRAAYVDEAGKFNLTPGQESDEIAAKVVEQAIDADGNFRPGFGFVKAVYARIAEFLRDLGLSVRFTHAELQGMLVNSQRRLEAGQRTAGSSQAPQPVWARSDTAPVSAAIVGEGLGAATGHPKYAAAKAGDIEAAVEVARALVTTKLVDQVREVIGDGKPVVVPVVSAEAAGRNKIPRAAAELLAQRLGLQTATGIAQANSPKRTAMDGLDRIFASPEFDGPVVAGQDYLILDDTLTQGATFATLAAHIEAGGGRVVAAVALTGKQYSARIAPSPDTLKALREKLGDLETDFRAATGYGFDALTESEARYLTNFKPAESVRARILEEGRRGSQRQDQGDAGGLTDPAFARDATLKTPAAVQAEAEIDRQNPPTAGQPDLFTPGFWETPQDTRTDKFIFEVQDGRIDLKRVQEAIAKVGGQIREQFDARLAETLYPGRVAQRAQQFLEDEAKPLLEVMARNNVPMAELSDYLHARGAEERNAQIAKVNPDLPDGGAGRNSKGVLLTNDAARAYLAAVTPARKMVLDALAKRVDAITSGTRKLLVDEGLEKAETIEAWEKAYSNYVPMFRDEAEAGRPHPTGSGMSVRGSASKRATGSTKAVTNILAHVLMQREAAITRAEKNRVAVALYGMALTNPNPDFWTTIRPGMAPEAIGRELQRMGVDPTVAEAGMKGVPTIRTVDPVLGRVVDRPNPMYKSLAGAIVLKVNGEDRVLMLNERDPRGLRMAENLKNLDGLTRLDLANRMVGKATRWLASVNTQYNPAFGLVNLTRDTLGGAINLSSTRLRGKTTKVLALTPAAIRGIALELSGAPSGDWGKLWRQFQADGGQTGYREMFKDANDRTARLQAELKSLEKAGKLTSEKVAGKILGALDIFNTTLENAVRLAAYREALQEGMSRPEAARLGRELTVDFNRKGRTGREVGPLYAFFNASVQGSARTLQTLAGPAGAKIIAGGVMLGVMQAIMLLLAGYDDDEIPEFVKTRAFIVPLGADEEGKKKYFTIPYPLGLHVLPNTGRVLAELTLAGGDGAAKRGMEAIGEIAGAFNPLGGGNIFTGDGFLRTVAPSVVDPIVETLSNKNFAGAPIERESQGENDPRPGFQRAREATLRTATGQTYTDIARIINTMSGGDAYEKGAVSPSPEMVRYWTQVVGGGLLREIEKIVNTSVDVAKDQPVKPTGIPVFGRFYGEVEDASVQRSRYYDNLREIERAEAVLSAAEKKGDGVAMEAIMKKRPEAALVETARSTKSSLRDLNKLAMQSVDDPATVKEVDEVRTEIMRSLNVTADTFLREKKGPTPGERLRSAVARP